MKKNEKGFTLIELLAVIVILGLLMAIAIPSVTKYITNSRKQTLVKTIDSYISALALQVNDGDYKFTYTQTAMGGNELHIVYAVPIECIDLEKGGANPFGEWMQANDNYWAYVLVQYDNENYSYNYGFTFKDSAGYGMYPTKREEIDSSGSAIRQKLTDLNRPTSGAVQNTVIPTKWKGFNLTTAHQVFVLKATSEGEVGNGETTCTLQQKGSNYDEVYREQQTQNNKDDYTIYSISETETRAFWQYRRNIKSVKIETNINIPNSVDSSHKWDISVTGNGKVMAYITPRVTEPTYYDLVIQGDGAVYANPNSSYLFDSFINLDRLDLTNFDTSRTTDMIGMFYKAGYDSKIFTITLGNKFDTSNVLNMNQLFNQMGYSSTNYTLDLGDKFDTSKVTDMYKMFYLTGYTNPNFTLNLGNKFNTGKVKNMKLMFGNAGYNSSSFRVDCSGWDVSQVANHDDFYTGPAGRVTLPTAWQ